MADYSKLPAGVKVKPQPFRAQVSEEKLQHFKDLLKLSTLAPATYENTSAGRQYGMTREYLGNAKRIWEGEFDWRRWEQRINSFPNFTMAVEHDGVTLDLHFVALFSERADAIPIVFYHGWPGSFLEFLQLLDLLKHKYSPRDLPYHVIVPSLPGYAYSSGPPIDRDYTGKAAGGQLDQLMTNLGFTSYVAQGGDVGSFISRWQLSNCDACVGAHLNMCALAPRSDEGKGTESLHDIERAALATAEAFGESGMAYMLEHQTRPSTIGLALSASPLALLSWIGEKFLAWSDEDIPLEEILASVTLYWLTDTYPRCIYPYRLLKFRGTDPSSKPVGYSLFPKEIAAAPKSRIAGYYNLVSYSMHESGGHFAAMEKPKELLADVEEFVRKAWKGSRL